MPFERPSKSLSRKSHNCSQNVPTLPSAERSQRQLASSLSKAKDRSTTRKLVRLKTQQQPLDKPGLGRRKASIVPQGFLQPAKQRYQAALQRGKSLLQQQRFEQALAQLKKSSSPQSLFCIGSCFVSMGRYKEALQSLKQYRQRNHRRQSTYILLSICYNKMGQPGRGVQILNTMIGLFPLCYDAHFYRAKLKLKMKRIDQADKEFAYLVKAEPHNHSGYVGQAQVAMQRGLVQDAIRLYDKAIELAPDNRRIRMKRIEALAMIRMYEQAQAEIQQLSSCKSEETPSAAQQLFFFKAGYQFRKAKVNSDSQTMNLAQLLYELCFREDPESKLGQKSLAELIKIKIAQRCFYDAAFHAERIATLSNRSAQLHYLGHFAQGTVCLMKRKFDEGVQHLRSALKHAAVQQQSQIQQYLCYGLMFQLKIDQAFQRYSRLQPVMAKLKPDIQYQGLVFNKKICQAIMLLQKNRLDDAVCAFQDASNIRPTSRQPYFYKSLTLTSYAVVHVPDNQDTLRKQMLYTALKEYTYCTQKEGPKASGDSRASTYCSNALYHRALLLMHTGHHDQALRDIESAVQAADEVIAQYYLVRGLAHAHLGDYQRAELDLSQCLQKQSIAQCALRNLIMVELAAGQLQKALNYLELLEQGKQKISCSQEEDPPSPNSDIRSLIYFCRGQLKQAQRCMTDKNSSKHRLVLQFLLGRSQMISLLNSGLLFPTYERQHLTEELGLSERQEHVLLGLNHFMGKRFSNAVKEFNMYLFEQVKDQLDPQQTIEMRYNAAICQLARGNFVKGNQLLAKLGANPGCTRVLNLIDYMAADDVQLDEIFFQPFECEFSKHLQWIQVQLQGRKRVLNVRPAISRLYFRPVVEFQSSLKFLIEKCTWRCVEMRAQAPWIVRDSNGVIFTNKVDKPLSSEGHSSDSQSGDSSSSCGSSLPYDPCIN